MIKVFHLKWVKELIVNNICAFKANDVPPDIHKTFMKIFLKNYYNKMKVYILTIFLNIIKDDYSILTLRVSLINKNFMW